MNIRPRGDYYDDFCDNHAWMHGHIDAIVFDYQDLEDEEFEAWQKERREALARKRPAGFAPWPDAIPESDA